MTIGITTGTVGVSYTRSTLICRTRSMERIGREGLPGTGRSTSQIGMPVASLDMTRRYFQHGRGDASQKRHVRGLMARGVADMVQGGDGAGARPEFILAPASGDLTVLDDLIAQAAERGAAGMDAPLVAGIVRWGPHFLWRLEERMRADERIIELFQRGWVLFGAWLGGQLYTDDARELDWRARAGLELWRTGSDAAAAFELLIAQCVLALPRGHELRDEERARSMIETALRRAREEHDDLQVLRCGRSLLWSLHLVWEENSQLIDEGLAILASLGDDAGPEAAELAAEWRLSAAFALSAQGQRIVAPARDEARDEARALFERSLEVYEPVMLPQQADPQAAIRTVWHWGHLLMNAGYPKLAAETFAAVRDLDTQGSDLWWHATYEEGLVRADVGDWSRARGLLRGIQESLLVNYAAWVCFAPGAAELGLTRLSDDDEPSAHRELSEGMGTLALAEAVDGDWAESFRQLETTKALDYRQRTILRHSRRAPGTAAARTEGHSGFMHGVPVIETDDERAQLTAALASELRGPTIGQVARSLAADQAVLSLGIAQGMWGMCVVTGDAEQPSGTLLRTDAGSVSWMELLGTQQLAELFQGSGDISGFDDALAGLLAQVDELIAAPVAGLLRDRDIRHLTVIPDGWLNLLPMAALPSFAEVAVSSAASARLVAAAPQAVELGRQALIVVDPVGDLPAAHAERAALDRHGLACRLALRSLTGSEATASAVSEASRGAGLFHFAGHATGNAMFPGKAGFVMAAGTPAAKGRIWEVGELEAEPGALSSCALAVLSACESGRGGVRIDSISDYSGLPPGLLALGVSAVVATLWRIPDDLGALFADLFYEKLAAVETADLPQLVHDTRLDLRTLTGSEGAERLMALRAGVSDAIARVRLEAYARRLRKLGARQPFAGPASWTSFYHTGVRYLRLPDPGKAS